MENNIILLTGHRKCGTTLFLNLFDHHPKLCCYPWDLHLLFAYFPEFLKNNQRKNILLKRLETIICENVKDKIVKFKLKHLDSNIFSQCFLNLLKNNSLDDPAHVIRSLIKAWSRLVLEEDRSISVIKEVSSEIYAGELYDWFPNLKIIQLIRDPRDNYASLKSGVSNYYKKLGENENETLASLLHRGLLEMKLALINENRFGADRYMVIRFEDLVSNPESSMRKVSSFIGIDFNKSMLQPTVCGFPTPGNNFDKINMFSVTNKNVSRWSNRITKKEAKIIEFYFKGVMEQFGYNAKFSDKQQSEAVGEYYKWLNYRYYYHDRFIMGLKKP